MGVCQEADGTAENQGAEMTPVMNAVTMSRTARMRSGAISRTKREFRIEESWYLVAQLTTALSLAQLTNLRNGLI